MAYTVCVILIKNKTEQTGAPLPCIVQFCFAPDVIRLAAIIVIISAKGISYFSG
jgi:hypothetical protein